MSDFSGWNVVLEFTEYFVLLLVIGPPGQMDVQNTGHNCEHQDLEARSKSTSLLLQPNVRGAWTHLVDWVVLIKQDVNSCLHQNMLNSQPNSTNTWRET